MNQSSRIYEHVINGLKGKCFSSFLGEFRDFVSRNPAYQLIAWYIAAIKQPRKTPLRRSGEIVLLLVGLDEAYSYRLHPA